MQNALGACHVRAPVIRSSAGPHICTLQPSDRTEAKLRENGSRRPVVSITNPGYLHST